MFNEVCLTFRYGLGRNNTAGYYIYLRFSKNEKENNKFIHITYSNGEKSLSIFIYNFNKFDV